MERHEMLAMMTALKLAGMRAAYDDILADGLKRRHPVQQIIGTLLQFEIADKDGRSIKYQMASARLPAAKELAEFDSPRRDRASEIAGGRREFRHHITIVEVNKTVGMGLIPHSWRSLPGVLFEDDTIKKLVALRNGNRSAIRVSRWRKDEDSSRQRRWTHLGVVVVRLVALHANAETLLQVPGKIGV